MERELLLLGLLRQGEMHGYQLHDFIERNLSFCTDLKKATAYLVLDRMAERGWVTVREDREGNRPYKRVYQLTPAGESAFQQLLRENLAHFETAKTSSDIGLAFIDALPLSEAIKHLEQRRTVLHEHFRAFEGIPPHQGGYQILIERQRHMLRAELAWLDQLIARLRSGEFVLDKPIQGETTLAPSPDPSENAQGQKTP